MEATFAEASANNHVARLVAKEFCGGDQMWKMEQVAESETGTADCGTGTAGPRAASRILLLSELRMATLFSTQVIVLAALCESPYLGSNQGPT